MDFCILVTVNGKWLGDARFERFPLAVPLKTVQGKTKRLLPFATKSAPVLGFLF
jgi:hypothetical protein